METNLKMKLFKTIYGEMIDEKYCKYSPKEISEIAQAVINQFNAKFSLDVDKNGVMFEIKIPVYYSLNDNKVSLDEESMRKDFDDKIKSLYQSFGENDL